MSNLSFLSNITLEPVVKVKTVKTPKALLPETADLRVFASGRIYPSEAFAKKHNLEFGPRIELANGKSVPSGNGLDIFRGTEWEMIKAQLPAGTDVLFIAVVPKAEAKVDLWGSCRYDENGVPKSSVFTQGVTTFSKERLVGMIEEVLGVTWEAVEYVDLVVDETIVMKSPNNLYYLPKLVSSGENKGQDDIARRENLVVNPLVLATDVPSVTKDTPELEDAKDAEDITTFVAEESTTTNDWAAALGAPEAVK